MFKALVVSAIVAVIAAPMPLVAADIRGLPPIPLDRPADATSLDDFVRREAVLLLIRETFSLVDSADVMQELASGVGRRGTVGTSEADQLALDRALLAEGSYYLVSLRYLILAGGAAWPTDRAASHYENDALVKLDALQDALFDAVATRADPLAVFVEAQQIWALTEGYVDVPEHLEVFGHRDAIVEDVVGGATARTST